MDEVVVLDHDPEWAALFTRLRSEIRLLIGDLATTIEHVGSTSVPDLPAKPIIDMTIVVPVEDRVPSVIERLATIGYTHRGDLGVPGREAFLAPDDTPAHHLYLCVEGNLALRNHLAIRDLLRGSPDAVQTYGALKKQLATRFRHDIDGYVDGKTAFLVGLLTKAGFTEAERDEIGAINRKSDG